MGGVALRDGAVSPDLPRLQLTVGIVLLFVHALSWYRGQFESQRSEVRVMEQLAHTDLLTNLPNRRGMYPAVEALIGSGGAAMLLDLDYFKRVNDEFGHQVGTRCWRGRRGCWRRSCRRGAGWGAGAARSS